MDIDKLKNKINKEKEKIDKLILIRNEIPNLSIKEIKNNMKSSRLVSPPDINTCYRQQFDIDDAYTLDTLMKKLQDYCKKYKVDESNVLVSLEDVDNDYSYDQNPYKILELSCLVEKTLSEYIISAIKQINEKIKKHNNSISNYNKKIKKQKNDQDDEYENYLKLKEKFKK